jgi:hypothetical protein
MMHRLAILTILGLGCGAKEPAKSAADAEMASPRAETRQESAPAATPKPQGATAASSPAPSSAASSSPASPDDLRDMLQAVLDDDALTSYLHMEQPNRFPLRISGRDVPQNLQLTKGTKPVVIVDDPRREPKKPVLVFTEIEIKGAEATVRYRYDIEGVRGSATLHKPYGRWAVKQSHVAEH